jgi:hypothetical protein
MIGIDRLSVIPAISIAAALACALMLPAGASDCAQWGLPGSFDVVQNNGFSPHFSLTQTATALRGSATYQAGGRSVHGSVEGSIDEDEVELTVKWGDGTKGLYRGTISPTYSYGALKSGSMKGYTVDVTHRGPKVGWQARDSAQATIFTQEILACLTLAKDVPAAPPPPPAAPPPAAPPATPAPPAPVQPQGFAGIWDSITGEGVNYTLTLDAQGSGSVGAVDARLDGTLQGTLSVDGKQLTFIVTQPKVGIVSRGQLSLSGDGISFAGQITKDTDGIPRSWTGTRRP